ncbi:MAG: RNA polymerase sigma-70 factor [Bacteroidia bacterium]|nr:RNA polymerase sigma-70 factor [Bacteroidia bacterium]
MELSNQQLINGIQKGDIAAFEELYRQYYIFLCLIAEHIVRNHSDAEEIVSDVFVRLWNIREKIDITTSIKGYLIKAVHNTSFNYLERFRLIHKLTDTLSNSDYELLAWDSDYPLGQLYEKEIMNILDQGISTLPDGCREIFILSRNEGMKYSAIAGKLGISVNTVKTQMKIALARLRENLKDYLMILFIIMGI